MAVAERLLTVKSCRVLLRSVIYIILYSNTIKQKKSVGKV